MINKLKLKLSLVLFLTAVMTLGGAVAAVAGEPTDAVQTTIDKVVKIVTSEKYKNDKKARRAQMKGVINQRFSYEQMGMRSLAREWDKRTDQEKTEFIDLFGKLLENSYSSKIESYSEEKILYKKELVKGEYALVKTDIERVDGTVSVDYKLIKLNGKWQVYDFIIEGVSMVRNYRSQFKKIIAKDSYQHLVKKLSDKITDLENGAAESENL